ncbi:MAG: DUF1554 domain-containing protein [Myxococcota bacterium]
MCPARAWIAVSLALSGCFSDPLRIEGTAGEDTSGDSTGAVEETGPGATSVGGSGGTPEDGDDDVATTADPPDTGATTEADSETGSETDSETDSATTGGSDAVCGDDVVEGDEECDEPFEPVLDGCRPDCTRIPTKTISLSNGQFDGDLGPDPVAFADSTCDEGDKAMFVFGTARRATTNPWGSTDPIDWVLAPHTAYVRDDGALLWVTDAVPLLGVRNGAEQSLAAPIVETLGIGFMTGMTPDWRTRSGEDCLGWTSSAPTDTKAGGVSGQTESDGYLDNGGAAPCDGFDAFYCVEQ